MSRRKDPPVVKLIVQPEAGIAPIVQALRRAKHRIDIAIFRLDRDEIEKALAAAVQRGVKVRALIAHTNRGGEKSLRKLEQRLLEAGVLVARTADELEKYHGKYFVADDTLHMFGFNFTKLDMEHSRSFGIQTKDRRTVQEALKLFEADTTRQPYQPGRSNLVVSPETARATLQNFLAGAKKQLSIYDLRIQDPSLIRLLKERAAKGVDVRILGALKNPGPAIQVRKLAELRQHVRAIVRDGTRAFVGSMSLRKLELESRREVGLIISNPSVTRRLLETFEADWEEAGGKLSGKELEREKERIEAAASELEAVALGA